MKDSFFQDILEQVKRASPSPVSGRVIEVVGFLIKAYNPGLRIGDTCYIINTDNEEKLPAEVVGLQKDIVMIMPLGVLRGLGSNSYVIPSDNYQYAFAGEALLGRCIDALGNPIDGKGTLRCSDIIALHSENINPLERKIIDEPIDLGVRSINGLMTCGKGQRIGIIAGSGVGKSVLLSMMARNTDADVNVIALIGERGREVREFIEKDLREEGLKHSVVVTVTSDQAPLLRLRGSYLATAIAEYFREQGKNVLLMMDSITRFAMAQREIGLAVGEPPTTKGYPPSVFSLLPKLLERAGNSASNGSLTALYTVLIEADDINDPIGDTVRSIVDGHIVLSRDFASKGHYPAVDVLGSLSRVMTSIVQKDHAQHAQKLRQVLALYKEAEDLINIGAYIAGSNPQIDYAIAKIDIVNQFLQQDMYEGATLSETESFLQRIFQD